MHKLQWQPPSFITGLSIIEEGKGDTHNKFRPAAQRAAANQKYRRLFRGDNLFGGSGKKSIRHSRLL